MVEQDLGKEEDNGKEIKRDLDVPTSSFDIMQQA